MKRRSRRNPTRKYTTSLSARAAERNKTTSSYYRCSSVKSTLKILAPSIALVMLLIVATLVLFSLNASQESSSDKLQTADKPETVASEQSTYVESNFILSNKRGVHGAIPEVFISNKKSATELVMSNKKTIMYKTTSNRVQILQERLLELGYLNIDETTTYYGPATRAAVIAFQRQHGIKKTGNANTKTLDLMFSEKAELYALYKGNEGDDVEIIQQILSDLAYLDTVTGYYGELTVAAVTEFQRRNSLPVTGDADCKTIAMMYNSNAVPGSQYEKKERRRAKINLFIDIAYAQIGKRYSLGSTGPNSFDCSGLVYYCLREAGSSRRRLTAAGYSQVNEWEKITSMSNLEIGDLLFFYSSSSRSRIGHVGIYIGGGRMIDASTSSGRIVKQSCRTSYWSRLYAFARRPW